MELKDTIVGMVSPDYKERFIAEYNQLKIRYQKLRKFVGAIEEARRDGVDEPKHDCPLELLIDQLIGMELYLRALEKRAVIEGIKIEPLEEDDYFKGWRQKEIV